MEWTDERIHEPGNPIENRQESKVMAALRNFSRASATTLDWAVHAEGHSGRVLRRRARAHVRVRPSAWRHMDRESRTGENLASEAVAFCQSKYEIEEAVVTAEHLDFCIRAREQVQASDLR